jgi:thymidylate synthase
VDKNKKLNMFVVQRSGDMFLGIPYDIALFTQILLYVASVTKLKPNKLELQVIDAHVYSNQKEAVLEYLGTETYTLPKYDYNDFNLTIKNYKHGKIIKAPVAI